jgi:aspartyl-tRNA(Asn)/glutamyl-tRNA(Gln) amidotransferase subunit A
VIKYKNRYEVIEDLQNGIKLENVVGYYLNNIEKNIHLNVFVEVYKNEATDKARILQEKFDKNPNDLGLLFGMVFTIKDVISHKEHELSAASNILKGYTALYNSTAVERILAEDAIIIGRVNCDQFGMGSTNENSIYGPTRNAHNESLIPGGSSGASAVSLQIDSCMVALGTDTGGSVRQPAAFCSVYGFKPTYGRVSRHGLIAYASSFDQIGILSNSIENISEALHVIAGGDDFDSTCLQIEKPSYHIKTGDKKHKICYFNQALESSSIDPKIKSETFDYIHKLKDKGHEVVGVDSKYMDYLIPTYYILTTAEASSNLSRYDGIRFGKRSDNAKNLDEMYRKTRTEGFSNEVKRRIMLGTFVLSSGYYDAYYTQAQKVRRLIQKETLDLFEKFDFLLMPASPSFPWEIGAKSNNPIEMYLSDMYTVHANMVGIPGINIPISTGKNGKNIGIQFMSKKFEEDNLLQFAASL